MVASASWLGVCKASLGSVPDGCCDDIAAERSASNGTASGAWPSPAKTYGRLCEQLKNVQLLPEGQRTRTCVVGLSQERQCCLHWRSSQLQSGLESLVVQRSLRSCVRFCSTMSSRSRGRKGLKPDSTRWINMSAEAYVTSPFDSILLVSIEFHSIRSSGSCAISSRLAPLERPESVWRAVRVFVCD